MNLVLEESHEVIKIKYFTALVKSSPNDLSKPERQMTYWRALESVPDLEIIKGCFKKRQVKGKLLQPIGRGIRKGEIVEIQKYEEKESDVNIASHILLDCCREDIECIVLLSNDTDLKMPLRFARKQFEKRIGIISPNPNIHQDLKKISHFHKNITDDILQRCQFPVQVRKVKKPSNWS